MQKNIIIVLSNFFGVALVILLGTNITYRTNTIPKLQQDVIQKHKIKEKLLQQKEDQIA
jgi:hypothetical protein